MKDRLMGVYFILFYFYFVLFILLNKSEIKDQF